MYPMFMWGSFVSCLPSNTQPRIVTSMREVTVSAYLQCSVHEQQPVACDKYKRGYLYVGLSKLLVIIYPTYLSINPSIHLSRTD